ncbi:hypothetical protein [Marinomonas algarum]|uniref:Uncharacterized protein n=1 Tax=Marinomonas algarum TaxID=2883105 RepID=A0A9X1LEX7_9GAMM|nr:hypothetical protein [Marinomonas algarum]MCB5162236.1 hypothetical protein [Marinomonas algarum]
MSMIKSLLTSSFFLFATTNMINAHGKDLIAFGQACLLTEKHVQQAQQQLEQERLGTLRYQKDDTKQQTEQQIQTYQQEKEALSEAKKECAANAANSAYCHRVRSRDNEITYMISKLDAVSIGTSVEQTLTDNLSNQSDYAHRKKIVDQEYARFIAQCRDSDTHYALLQDPTAYAEVCMKPNAQHTITCSFF